MTNIEKVKHIREITMSPVNKINAALAKVSGDVAAAIQLLILDKQADTRDMASRVANASIVYSYVHNNRIGAMLVIACQTDFVSKNEVFLKLAKDICMHIVSSPIQPEYVDESNISELDLTFARRQFEMKITGKPLPIINKIVDGQMSKYLDGICLLRQKFVKNDSKTVNQLIQEVSSVVGEKIQVKKFVRMVAQ